MIMNLSKALTRIQTPRFNKTIKLGPDIKWFNHFHPTSANFPVSFSSISSHSHQPMVHDTSEQPIPIVVLHNPAENNKFENVEVNIEKSFTTQSLSKMAKDPRVILIGQLPHPHVIKNEVIYGCRFFAILAVWGSLIGSFLCFFKGCVYVITSYNGYFVDRMKVIGTLVEATDVYLLGTVMLVFGMGLYELFISNLDQAKSTTPGSTPYQSNLFGMFVLKERPRWLEIKTVGELKTKIGHVIVMLLLIGLFDKSKKAVIQTPVDLLCFAAAVLLSSLSLYLLSRLHD